MLHPLQINSAAQPARAYICRDCIDRFHKRSISSYLGHAPKFRIPNRVIPLSLPRPTPVALQQNLKSFKNVKVSHSNQCHKAVGVPSAYPTRKLAPSSSSTQKINPKDWELTVGIEIHAELNTSRKLLSSARTATEIDAYRSGSPSPSPPNPYSSHVSSTRALPNTRVAVFDTAFPGSQPQFQRETVIPAIRAALALGCEVQQRSSFDRKHYFYHDQPNGYQITQYYEPLAENGGIELHAADGIAPEDGKSVRIVIQRIQMEQDTAKSIQHGDGVHLIDFNRASHPLIEIITAPQIHHPATAAALVRKVQGLLKSVDAVTAGMEMGGLRADVNISVRRKRQNGMSQNSLGQRTEIKNLSSFKAVQSAIVAERDRQIAILGAGGTVVGETRFWTGGLIDSRILRSKDDEVDYRYMPDPDLGPVLIGQALVDHLRQTLPLLPDQLAARLVDKQDFGLKEKDARILATMDDGGIMLDYYMDVVKQLKSLFPASELDSQKIATTVANWTIHELGRLIGVTSLSWKENPVSAESLASLLLLLLQGKITVDTAKLILAELFESQEKTVDTIVSNKNLLLQPLSQEQYLEMAKSVLDKNAGVVEAIRAGKGKGKIMYLVGQMIRTGEKGRLEPIRAQSILEELLNLDESLKVK